MNLHRCKWYECTLQLKVLFPLKSVCNCAWVSSGERGGVRPQQQLCMSSVRAGFQQPREAHLPCLPGEDNIGLSLPIKSKTMKTKHLLILRSSGGCSGQTAPVCQQRVGLVTEPPGVMTPSVSEQSILLICPGFIYFPNIPSLKISMGGY